jgi:hypothetical protein
METVVERNSEQFVDRRSGDRSRSAGAERRQFSATVDAARPEVAELSQAVDQYKLAHRRRFITFDELYDVIRDLGYHK